VYLQISSDEGRRPAMSVIEHPRTKSPSATEGRPRPYARPGVFLGKVVNPIVVALGRKTVLIVRGRKSGKLLKVPMDPPFEWNGTRYLISPRGETHWARNLRVAGEADLRTRSDLEHVRVVAVHGEERDAVVKSYASSITCNCLRYMKQLPDPADHPVFRIEPTAT
jgi:hypothetical protein